MTDDLHYVEASGESTGDASRIARPVNHNMDVHRRLRQPGRLTEAPDLGWQWESSRHSFRDIVFTADGVRLVSPKMRDILEAHRTADDEIQWLPGVVLEMDGVEHLHWVPHFPQQLDLLDHERSTFGPSGLPIRYVLSASKLAPHAVTIMGNSSLTFILAGRVIDDLDRAGCTGIRATQLRLAP